MTTPITATGTTPTSPSPTAAAASGLGGLGQDTFLKLLVAQLKYQNPMSPTDPSTFLAQSAQFTMVEKLNQIADHESVLAGGNGVLTGAALIGKTVSWDDGTGAPASGVVKSVQLDPSKGAVLTIGDKTVPIDAVREIKNS
jgi:flagellar basal-body rod modification protein FlgD